MRPLALQQTTLASKHRLTVKADRHLVAVDRLTDHRHAVAQTSGAELRQHVWGGVLMHLNHGAQLFVEQHSGQFSAVIRQRIEEQIKAAMAGEGHFQRRHQQTAVRTVVVSQDVTVSIQALDHREEGLEVFSVVHIRRLGAELAVHLTQNRSAHAVLTTTQIDQDQVGFALIHAQLRGQGLANIANWGKAGHHQRQRRSYAFVCARVRPLGFHRHRVFAHRNGDAQLGAQLHTDRFHGVVQACVFTGVAGSGHPVGRQFDVGDFLDVRGGQVGQCLANRHAPGGCCVEQGQRRALTHGHGFAGVHIKAGGGHSAVGHRHLPRANHLITRHQAGNGTVADGDQKALASHGRVMQHAGYGFVDGQAAGIEIIAQLGLTGHRTVHARRFAQQHFQWHVHRSVGEIAVSHRQMGFFGGFTYHGKRATLALADRFEPLEIDGADRQHVTFLRLVAPDFVRGHARLVVGHVAQLETTTTTTVVDKLWEGVGNTARADVMDKGDGVVVAQLPATVDHFLATALHFRVLALHRGKVQISGAGTGGDRRSGTAA